METRKKLPVYQFEREVLEQIDNNDTVIIIGDTAIGKTTQIPQILLKNGYGKEKCIAVIQPRQYSAIMASAIVAEDLKTNIGEKIGYSVAFENASSSVTKIKYLTDFELLRELYLDRSLSDYSIIILDEAQERTLNSDILYGIVKVIQSIREKSVLPLKVIVLSAPINFGYLFEYFDDAFLYELGGHDFHCQRSCKNSKEKVKDHISAAVTTVLNILQNEDDGFYNVACGSDIESIWWTSKVQQDQRSARAGREFNGICYQLYTAEEKKGIKKNIDPEILRSDLSSTILHMIAIGIKDVENFNYIDKPPDQNIFAAIEKLKSLDAIIGNNGSFKLTECGKKMVSFPLDPRFSKMIITSETYGCTCEIITIISFLLLEPIFYAGISHIQSKQKNFIEAMKKFEENKDFIESDLILLLNIYKFYEESGQSLDWCHQNFISSKVMSKAYSIRKYLFQICSELGINNCSCYDTRKIIMCLASGLFMNAAIHQKDKTYKTVEGGLEVEIHSTSCLYRSGSTPYCCLYSDLVQDSKIYMRHITEMDLSYLLELTPDFY